MGCLWVVILGTWMRLLTNNNTSGIEVAHVGMLRKVVLLVRHHVHGVLSCKLACHPGPGHGNLVPLCAPSIGSRGIGRLRESVGHGVHIEGTC